MKNKRTFLSLIMLVLASVLGIWLIISKNTESKASDIDLPPAKVSLISIEKSDNATLVKINYTLPKNDPILTISSPQINNIDLTDLKQEFDDGDIGDDVNNKQIHLNFKKKIDDKGSGEFTIKLNNNRTHLFFLDVTGQQILDQTINEKDSEPVANDPTLSVTTPNQAGNSSENSSDSKNNTEKAASYAPIYGESNSLTPEWNDNWVEINKMMASYGKVTNNPDGSSIYPVIYFGAINYALDGETTPHRSVGGRDMRIPGIPATSYGFGRYNNITAANTGVIYVPKGSTWSRPQQKNKNKNQYYTNTFGDGLYPDRLVNKGSQRNFTTTNIFDYTHASKDPLKPTIYGPDYEEKNEWGIDEENVHFYTRVSKESGELLNEQRMVFYQVNHGIRIQVTITQRFNKDNAVIVTYEYKNVSDHTLDNFQGYVFRDITFHKGVRYDQGAQKNKLRSLGNNRGLYASRPDYGGRIEFQLNDFEDSPFAWAARGTRSTTFEAGDKDHFPWNKKGLENTYNDAFININDTADKYVEPGAGNTWMELKKDFDSGLSMHTQNQLLAPGEQVSMTYGVNMRYINSKPNLSVYNDGLTRNSPYIMKPEQNFYDLHGTWHHYGENDVNVKYRIKEINTQADNNEDPTNDLLRNKLSATNGYAKQSNEDKKIGKVQSFSKKIPLDEFGPGLYKISVIALDKAKQTSQIETRYVSVPSRTPQRPIIAVKSPVDNAWSTTAPGTEIYDLKLNKSNQSTFDLSGTYLSYTKNFKITYTSNFDSTEREIKIPPEEKVAGKTSTWKLKDFNVRPILNDGGDKTIHFKIVSWNENGTSDNEDYFHFRINQDNSIGIDAPNIINFGIKNLAPKSEVEATSPKMDGSLFIYDYRDRKAQPIKVNLKVENFIEKK
ncbi:hypothetical protein [Companilactobacillus furfuricola]|uniref:hypothetical protein n=1 Tax=Companilactobacillus furfuricola TaxID=1462575 RepID=UPI000F7A965B|nr:hypothetical protein [Companilactobacillus furfuricola]